MPKQPNTAVGAPARPRTRPRPVALKALLASLLSATALAAVPSAVSASATALCASTLNRCSLSTVSKERSCACRKAGDLSLRPRTRGDRQRHVRANRGREFSRPLGVPGAPDSNV